MAPDPFTVQSAVDKAAAEGFFDNSPLAGKPLNLPRIEDPNWWITQRLRDDDIDRDALLPTVILLKRERDAMPDTLQALPTEEAVRAHLHEYNERVRRDRTENPHPSLLAPILDVEAWVDKWREGTLP